MGSHQLGSRSDLVDGDEVGPEHDCPQEGWMVRTGRNDPSTDRAEVEANGLELPWIRHLTSLRCTIITAPARCFVG